MTPSLMGSGTGSATNNTAPSSPVSSSSATPNSSQILAGDCTSPSLMSGHEDSPLTISSTPITSNGY